MLTVICYDIVDDGTRQAVSDWLSGWGLRVQYSVFDCHLSETEFKRVKARIEELVDPAQDKVRYLRLCKLDEHRVAVEGRGEPSRAVAYRIY